MRFKQKTKPFKNRRKKIWKRRLGVLKKTSGLPQSNGKGWVGLTV